MDATGSSAWYHIPEDNNLHDHCHGNLTVKSIPTEITVLWLLELILVYTGASQKHTGEMGRQLYGCTQGSYQETMSKETKENHYKAQNSQ
jgi:hypothetical protein